jgi:hypothetical protein
MTAATFYLGTHETSWLEHDAMPTDACLFVSHRRLALRRTLPKGRVHWALDSGGFTELQMYGEWRTTPQQYVAAVRRYDEEIGGLGWAAPQDWMCEPIVINGGQVGPVTFAGTKLSVEEHQRRTVDNFVHLSDLWGDADSPFMPVLQGYQRDDYLRCWDRYDAAGINLKNYPVVGLGSVCRRQAEDEIGDIVTALLALDEDLPVHGFGVKLRGLEKYGHLLNTADSLAWSMDARNRRVPLPECVDDPTVQHKNCANCIRYALRWRRQVLDLLSRGTSPNLSGGVS